MKFDHLGGDASLLHLASQMDRGIHKKIKEIETPRAANFRKCYLLTSWLRAILLVSYVGLT